MKKINLKKPTRNQVIRICNLLSVPLQFLGCCVLYLVIEALSRHSLREAWQYMTGSPLIFLYNAFLIFTTSLVVYLFRHRILARTIVGCFWFILGCVNGFLLLNRVTPFTGPDLKLINDAMRILNPAVIFHLDVPKRLEISGKDALLAEYSADCCWCGNFCVDK